MEAVFLYYWTQAFLINHSATLIDHIFTNNLTDYHSMLQGIFVTDITDHYPIFHVLRKKDVSLCDKFFFTRKMSEKKS